MLREAPFIRLCPPMVIGIWLSTYTDNNLPLFLSISIGLALGLGLIALHRRKTDFSTRWWFGALLGITLIWGGFQLGFYYKETHRAAHYSEFTAGRSTMCLGRVTEPISYNNTVKVYLEVNAVRDSLGNWQTTQGHLLAYAEIDSTAMGLKYGDLVAIQTKVSPTVGPRNPNTFDYRQYLAYQNIYYQTYLPAGNIKVLEGGHVNPLYAKSFEMRERFLKILRRRIPTDQEYAVTAALIIGYKDDLSDDLRTAYSATGATHLLAVSGGHLVILATILQLLLGKIPIRRRWWKHTQFGILMLVVWGFSLLTGLGGSILRAAVMFTFLAIAAYIGRRQYTLNTLAASAFSLLILNPFLLFDAGFQLSYAAVAGIVIFQRKISGWFYFENIILRYLWELVAVSIGAQLGTLPLVLLYFHQFPVYFWLSGLAGVPISTIALPAGRALYIFDQVPYLADALAFITYGSVWLMNAMIFSISTLPLSVIGGFSWRTWQAYLLYIAVFSGALLFLRDLREDKNRRPVWLMLCSLLVLGSFGCVKQLHDTQQHAIVFYQLKKTAAIDFIDGNKSICLRDSSFNDYGALAANRMARSVSAVEDIYFETNRLEYSYFKKQHNAIQFLDKTLVIIDEDGLPQEVPPRPIYIDVLILHKAKLNSLQTLSQYYAPNDIVIDGTNSYSRSRAFNEEALRLGWSVHNLQKDGAWVWNF